MFPLVLEVTVRSRWVGGGGAGSGRYQQTILFAVIAEIIGESEEPLNLNEFGRLFKNRNVKANV